jgi:transcriptional regulator
MYIPPAFAMPDVGACHEAILANSFGEFVTVDPDGLPIVAHLPFLLDGARGPNGTLIAHLARENPQIQQLSNGKIGLAAFRGAHAYISPSWYTTHPSVPTWNYIAVHAYGIPVVIEDPAAVHNVLRRLVSRHEAAAGTAWHIGRLDDRYLAEMTERIVAFEMPIDRLEGKAKLSQNRSDLDRAGVVGALRTSLDPIARSVAEAMVLQTPSKGSDFDQP